MKELLLTAVGVCALAGEATIPVFEVPREETFDPAKAGWTCVFEDDFEGSQLDLSKWFFPDFNTVRPEIAPDGKGHLVFHVKKGPDGKIPNGYVHTVQEYAYGYFEARVRFTDRLGWWAAFWLNGGAGNGNSFMDGFEVDIFEDFYTRLKPTHWLLNRPAHSFHSRIGDFTSSFAQHSDPPEPLDGFHVIACKWDPLSLSFYLDGRLVGGLNAFNYAACIHPLHAILSAERMNPDGSGLGGHARPGCEEGTYEIDWVRIWQEPADKDVPKVEWIMTDTDRVFVEPGTKEKFFVRATPVAPSDPVVQAYLFDNGHMVAHDIEQPFDFQVTMSAEHYANTHYGRFANDTDRARPKFGTYPHVFVVFVRTASGKVVRTTPVYRIVAPQPVPRAYGGMPAQIPGTVRATRFDEGGNGVAYHKDWTKAPFADGERKGEFVKCHDGEVGPTYAGEWLNYAVDVAESGIYVARLHYGSPLRSVASVPLLVDGRRVGTFEVSAEPMKGWAPCRESSAEVRLEKGRHVLTVLTTARVLYKDMVFECKKAK